MQSFEQIGGQSLQAAPLSLVRGPDKGIDGDEVVMPSGMDLMGVACALGGRKGHQRSGIVGPDGSVHAVEDVDCRRVWRFP